MPRDKYKPLPHRHWTAQGDNGTDPPINVGIFSQERDAAIWSHRQNEVQRQQEWGRGSAGPMTFTPRPIYAASRSTIDPPDPAQPIFPERTWNPTDAD